MSNADDSERQKIKDFYDQEYYTDHRDHDALPWHYKVVAGRLGAMNGRHVLDIACGTGKWLELLASRGARVAGIDISELAIAASRARLPGSDFRVGSAEELPFEDSTFDLVTCLGSLEHFLDPQRALREMLRVGKPDCRFLLLVPNLEFLPARLGLFRGTHQVRVREVARSLPGWKSLFESAGMSIVAKWRDLHLLSEDWIGRQGWAMWPVRLVLALLLPVWPMAWQYQVYHYCRRERV